MPIWANALKKVNRSLSRLVQEHKAKTHYGHYALPEPALFVTPASDEKKISYIFTWLRARPALMYRLWKHHSTALSNQTWRNFLEMGRNAGKGLKEGAVKSAKSRELIIQVMGGVIDSITASESSSSADSFPVVWEGEDLTPGEMPEKKVVSEILWELFELNFRIELFSLDSRASLVGLDTQSRLERIQKCFVDVDFLRAHIPSANRGLVADDWETRLPYVFALRDIMVSWVGCRQFIKPLSPAELMGGFSKMRFQEVEAEVTQFYTQSFFDYFGRAASIPHCISPFTAQ
jgi:hypothetical protein